MSADSQWQRYQRRGEVTAEKRSRAWDWITKSGEMMHAGAGDWAVTGDDGRQWSVDAEVFDSTYENVGPKRYRRAGTVLARRAQRRETIATMEGDAVAEEGDWIVQGEGGEQWPVHDGHFRASYQGPVSTTSGHTPSDGRPR